MHGFLFTVQFIEKVATAFGLGEFPYIAKSVFRRTTLISFYFISPFLNIFEKFQKQPLDDMFWHITLEADF